MNETPGETPAPPPSAPVRPPPRPRRDLRLQARRAPATFGLLGFTLAVFVLQVLSSQALGFDLVIGLGAKERGAILAGQWWRLVTPLFVHAGLAHVFVNMYSLYVLGPVVERFFGSARTLAVYLASGVVGVAFSLALTPQPSVGASGAIFGLLGALTGFLALHRRLFGRGAAVQLRQLVFIALLNLALGLAPGIDNWGHVGGLLAGLALAATLGPRYALDQSDPLRPRLVDRRPWQAVWPGAVLAVVAALALGVAAALQPLAG